MRQCISKQIAVLLWLCVCGALLLACTSEQVIHANVPQAIRAQQPPVEQRLLDVAIAVFEHSTASAQDASEALSEGYLQIRKAEARYFAYTLKSTLVRSGHWGAVRLVPEENRSFDVVVTAQIVASSGSELVLDVQVRDATGRIWFNRRYSALASKYAYSDEHFRAQEPFQAVYNGIADDMLAARSVLADEALASVRRVAELKFAANLAPDAFEDYLLEDTEGRYSLNRLPSEEDPMLARVRKIRQRDLMLLDTLDGYYALFYKDMRRPYREWLKSNFEESVEMQKLQRSARNRIGMGAAAMLAGVAGGLGSDSSAGQAASVASAVGGGAVFASGLKKYDQAQIHVDALRELNDSFQADLQPKVMEFEGRVVTLTGSAEDQYKNWRRLLRRIYLEETGLPADSAVSGK
jgi:hypothetical protein